MIDDRRQPEVLVIGAGPAGSATARGLALRGRRVLLVERREAAARRVGETLAAELPLFLRPLQIDLSQLLARVPHLRSSGTSVAWGAGDLDERSAIMNPFGGGWHVDRPALDAALAELAAAAGAELATGGCPCGCVRMTGSLVAVRWGSFTPGS